MTYDNVNSPPSSPSYATNWRKLVIGILMALLGLCIVVVGVYISEGMVESATIGGSLLLASRSILK